MEELYNEFDSYLLNEMNAQEKSGFENKIQNYTDYIQAYTEYKKLIEGLQQKEDQNDIATKVQQARNRHEQRTSTTKRRYLILKIAAAIAVIVVAGTWYYLTSSGDPIPPDPEVASLIFADVAQFPQIGMDTLEMKSVTASDAIIIGKIPLFIKYTTGNIMGYQLEADKCRLFLPNAFIDQLFSSANEIVVAIDFNGDGYIDCQIAKKESEVELQAINKADTLTLELIDSSGDKYLRIGEVLFELKATQPNEIGLLKPTPFTEDERNKILTL